MQVGASIEHLWPTRITFYEADPDWADLRLLADRAIGKATASAGKLTSSERRVRDIFDGTLPGQRVRQFLFRCAQHHLGPEGAQYLDPDYCENRALVIDKGGFISTHKDSREGDLTCVLFLTGGGRGEPINSVGNPRFVLEDPSRYFDEGRLPYETRHGYSVNPRPGLAVVFPGHIPHNQHPYTGDEPHVQIVANFRVNIPTEIEERLFD